MDRLIVALAALLTLASCTDSTITGLERAECQAEAESYKAYYYPQWADSVVVYGHC